MKTSFEKVDGRWVVKTGKVVAVEYINYGDDFDVILADQYADVVTGETFAKRCDEFASDFVGENIWCLVKHYDEMPEYEHRRHGNQKKIRRESRIDDFVGVHWNPITDFKQTGKNRFYRRRMTPNKKQQEELDSFLPF